MTTTNDTHPRRRIAALLVGRVVLGIVTMAATLLGGIPVANAAARDDASAARPPGSEPCLNIVRCGTGGLPGEVDPGPPRRQADLPTPSIAVRMVEHYALTSTGRYSPLLEVPKPTGRYFPQIEVTNWKAYHETLFASDRRYPACGQAGNRFRTWVDILDGDSGRLHYRICTMGTPVGLSKLSLFAHRGYPIPERIAVRLVDNATNRVVTSHTVELPEFVRVGTRYTSAERANLEFAADYWDIQRHEVQKAGIMAIRYINGVAGTTGSKPLRPRPEVDRGITIPSDWYPDELHALEWVSRYHDLTYAETQKLGAAVMIYVAAVAQS